MEGHAGVDVRQRHRLDPLGDDQPGRPRRDRAGAGRGQHDVQRVLVRDGFGDPASALVDRQLDDAELQRTRLEQFDGGGDVVERGEARAGSPQALEPARHGGARLGNRFAARWAAPATTSGRRTSTAWGRGYRTPRASRMRSEAARAEPSASRVQTLGRRTVAPRSPLGATTRDRRSAGAPHRAPAIGRAHPAARSYVSAPPALVPSTAASCLCAAASRPTMASATAVSASLPSVRDRHLRLVDVEVGGDQRPGVGEEAAQTGGRGRRTPPSTPRPRRRACRRGRRRPA